MNSNDQYSQNYSSVIPQMNVDKLKYLLSIKVENRNEVIIKQISLLIKDISILPSHSMSQITAAAQNSIQTEKIDQIIASRMELFTVDSTFGFQNHIKDHKAIILILNGTLSLEINAGNSLQRKTIKQYTVGQYITFYDIEYAPLGSHLVISRENDQIKNATLDYESKNSLVEVGIIDFADSSLSQNVAKNLKIQNQNSFFQNYFDNIIKKEISLLKLNYGFIQNLSDNQIGCLHFISKVLFFTQKDPVYLNGDSSEFVYIVKKGSFCVLWRDSIDTSSQRKPIFKSNLSSESKLVRRWSLRVYEAKDIFGEEDIIHDCRKRCYDLICDSPSGQVIAIPKYYFLYILYPLLQNFFSLLVSNKERLLSGRINQIRSQQNKAFIMISPSLQSTQPISRECKESTHSSLSSISQKSFKIINDEQNIDFEPIIIQSEKRLNDDKTSIKNTKRIDAEEEKISFKNKEFFPLNKEQKKQIIGQLLQKSDRNMKHNRKNVEEINSTQMKFMKKNIHIKNIENSLSFTQKEDSDSQQDSNNKLNQFHMSLMNSLKQDKTSNIPSHIKIQTDKNLNQQKKQKQSQQSLLISSHKKSPMMKNCSSLMNVLLIDNSESPQKTFHLQQNSSQMYPQSSERRINKKTVNHNTLMKRQANRVSPMLNKAIVQKSSSESASQGTNNSEGGVTFLQALQGSKNIIKCASSKRNQNTFQSNSSSSVSLSSQKTLNNQQSISNSNGNVSVEISKNIHTHSQNWLDNQQKNSDGRKEQETSFNSYKQQQIQNITNPDSTHLQSKQQQQQQQQQFLSKQNKKQVSCFSKTVYKKIKDKEDIRKNLKKECDTLKKEGNLNALSDYSFKFGIYKIKSELLSNSYENLKQISTSNINDSNMIKPRRKFSGDENILSHKPKYLFSPQQNLSNKLSQKKMLLDKIIGGKFCMNGIKTKIPFFNQPLKKDVQGLLQEQAPHLIPIDKLIIEKGQKPTITQRAIKINTNDNIDYSQNNQQNLCLINQLNILELFSTESPLSPQKINTSLKIKESTQDQTNEQPQIEKRNNNTNQNVNTIIKNNYLHVSANNKNDKQSNQVNLINSNNIQLNKFLGGKPSLQQPTNQFLLYKQNLNSSARNHYGQLKQLLSSNLASPTNKSLSQQSLSNQQQTLSQLMNVSTNKYFHNISSISQHCQDIKEQSIDS